MRSLLRGRGDQPTILLIAGRDWHLEHIDWLSDEPATDIIQDSDGTTWWWTFASTAANTELALALGGLGSTRTASGLAIRVAATSPALS